MQKVCRREKYVSDRIPNSLIGNEKQSQLQQFKNTNQDVRFRSKQYQTCRKNMKL